MSRFSVDPAALGGREDASPFTAAARGAARLMSLHGSTRTGESLSALGERLTAELSRLASEIDDIVASTRLAASAYDRTETAILDLLTDLDRR